jgi:DNA transformation protein
MPSSVFKDFVLDQLSALPGVVAKSMFGGVGLYQAGVFFGIIFKGRFYLKTDDRNRPDFVARAGKPFRPHPGMTLRTYYEVPVDVLENRRTLAEWVGRAVSAAGAKKAGNGAKAAASHSRTRRKPKSG